MQAGKEQRGRAWIQDGEPFSTERHRPPTPTPQGEGKSTEEWVSGGTPCKNQFVGGALFFGANDLSWVTPVIPTLGLKWGRVTTANRCFIFIVPPPPGNSEFRGASSTSLVSCGELMCFPQQVLSATASSSPSSVPAKSWENTPPLPWDHL